MSVWISLLCRWHSASRYLQVTCKGKDAEAQDGHRPYDGDNQVDPSVARPPRHLPLVGLGVAVEQLHNRGDQGDVQNGGGQLGGGAQHLPDKTKQGRQGDCDDPTTVTE